MGGSDASDLVLSVDVDISIDGMYYADEDLVAFNGVGFSMFFDGSAAGVPAHLDLDGAHRFPSNGKIALSFDGSGKIAGVAFDDEDVLEYDAAEGGWEMAWDGSVERTGWDVADVDAVHFGPEPRPALLCVASLWGLAVLARLRSARMVSRA